MRHRHVAPISKATHIPLPIIIEMIPDISGPKDPFGDLSLGSKVPIVS
jgi:hypothetical protein